MMAWTVLVIYLILIGSYALNLEADAKFNPSANEVRKMQTQMDTQTEKSFGIAGDKIKFDFCKDNPTNSEKCTCVKTNRIFESASVNHSEIIEVNFYGYDCLDLIDDDYYYLLRHSRRKFVSVVPLRVERRYDCKVPCGDLKSCYFETTCFNPLNLSLLRYQGMVDGFPAYCSRTEEKLRVTANLTYEDPLVRITVERCVEAVPK